VEHGLTDWTTTVEHGLTDWTTTVEHGLTDWTTTVEHGLTDWTTTVEHGLTDRRMTISVIVCCIVKSLKTSPLTTTRSQPVTIVPKKLPDKI